MPNMIKKRKAIIFDMDNTLLQSRIDFPGMKTAVFQLLVKHQMIHPDLDYTKHSASQLIDLGRNSGRITEEIEASIWDTIVAYETEGMIGAALEEGAKDVLDALRHHYTLTILTNNARSAALQALKDTGIIPFFDLIAGREQMTELKPSPSGIHYILDKYPNIQAEEWIMVGDSWIDGKAAQDGGIGFIAYQSEPEEMKSHGVTPLAYVQRLEELLD
ncbi:phosphatase [Brevibacillus panacihumi W25]|uniref:Phosphatase n=1 Tax=Brevibacillus panacihumi W25 TaxID=1408254 RepID=V6MC32_9BACL|nr:HAD-IA family hydrolase [Brevibacillus panacihumi]EST52948.1 phosphatase [Brevibacillus panacihumi W25]